MKKLQGVETDIVKGYQEIDLLNSTVWKFVRTSMNTTETGLKRQRNWQALLILHQQCQEYEKHQTMQDNQPPNDAETYHRITVTSQLLDHLINQRLSLRFDTSQLSIVKGFSIIPTLMQERIIKQGRASWNTDFMEFAENYREDFPESESFKSELDIWEVYWLQKFGGKLPYCISNPKRNSNNERHIS